jgi:ribosomal protein S20
MNKEKQKNLEEISVSGGAEGGEVEFSGASKTSKSKREKKKMPEGYYIDRKQFIEELQIREAIREIIKKVKNRRKFLAEQKKQKQINNEQQLRSIIRTLIKEAKKDIADDPHDSTAINLLEELLKQILPNIETDYKTLTTKKEQRDSFRAHIINAVSTVLETEDVNKAGGGSDQGPFLALEEDENQTNEEVDIKISDEDTAEDKKFIDIGADEPETEEDEFRIKGQDDTGRALSQRSFDNIEKKIVETYGILSDAEDEKLFKDYLITNLKLYFDKWEKELGEVVEPTTSEYEAEKEKTETGGESGEGVGEEEFGGELDAEEPSEEPI